MYNRDMSTIKVCTDKGQWDDFVLDNGGHPLQLWGWGESKSKHGWTAERVFLMSDDEQPQAAVQVLIKRLPWPFRSLAYVPRGPVVGDSGSEELLDQLAQYVRVKYHSVLLQIEPDSVEYTVPDGWVKSKNRILPAETIVLDLTKSEDELMASMVKKTRQYIRKSGSSGIVIRTVKNEAELQGCLDLYHQTAERAKFDLHSDDYYRDIYQSMGENAPILVALVENQPVAFLWMAISADVAFELYGGMNDVGKDMRANYALKWAMICKCKEWGLSRYDFGGLIDGGVSNFKMGWADAETQLAGTFVKPLSVWYGLFSNVLPFAKKLIRKVKLIGKH